MYKWLIGLFITSFVCIHTIAHAKEMALRLSLEEAILLAIRSNPNVARNQLAYVNQKFALHVQKWKFEPQYSLGLTAGATRTSMPDPNGSANSFVFPVQSSLNITPAVSILTPMGTSFTLSAPQNITSHYRPGLSLEISQPLMRGFGSAIVESALNNARDSLAITQLNIEGTLRNTVTTVINAYLDIVSALRTLEIDKEALARAEKSVEQTKLFIKAGRKAGNEIITVKANVASARSKLENDKNRILQVKYALLAAIGLDPNTATSFSALDINQLISKYHLPPLGLAKHLALQNDIQYQIDQITLHGPTSRTLLAAKDNARWKLDLKANVGTKSAIEEGQVVGFNNLFNSENLTQGVDLQLTIPINDQSAKQAILNAKVALQQAELALQEKKWSKETSAINGWNTVVSAKRAVHFAVDAKALQAKTYHINYQKYLHGLIDSLELQQAQVQLIEAEQVLLRARIDYLKSLVNLDSLIGHTLKTWNVKVRL